MSCSVPTASTRSVVEAYTFSVLEGFHWSVDKAPPSPVYVPYVPEPAYPEFIPPVDEVLLSEEQPLPAALSPTVDSPGYDPESDPEEDPEEDDDEDPEEDPADYPADGGDNGDDEDESSNDDEDDDVDIERDEEEEEHPAPADSIVVALPVVDHALSAEETEISIRDEPPTPFWSDTEVSRLLTIPTPPPSPLSPWSSPLPQIPSPPLPPILSPLPVSSPPLASLTYPLGYRAAMIRLRAEALSTTYSPPPHIILSHTIADTPPSGTPPLLPIPLSTSSPSLLVTYADHGADMVDVCLPPRKRLCFAFSPKYEVGESSSAPTARPPGGFWADYGFVATMDREIRRDLERDVGSQHGLFLMPLIKQILILTMRSRNALQKQVLEFNMLQIKGKVPLHLSSSAGDSNGTYHRDEKEPYVEKFVVEGLALNGVLLESTSLYFIWSIE
ncbi:hypothetical protein Tco_1243925 [Tanacetum coccineum]